MRKNVRMIAIRQTVASALLLAVATASGGQENGASFQFTVLPPEHKKMVDPQTGTDLIFLTTNLAKDTNLYFHERSWLADGSLIFFNSARANGGPMAFLVETGELVRLATPNGGIGAINAAKTRNSLFGRRGDTILEWALTVEVSTNLQASPSKVTASERIVAHLPGIHMHTPPSESCDGRHLAVGVILEGARGIYVIDVASGEYRELCRMPEPSGYGGHVQWSHNNPNMLSFAGRPQRLMVVDIRAGIPKSIYTQREGELVTHEHWWAPDAHGDDQMVFCGGLHPEPAEDSHVKVIDVRTGVVRIIGAGAWWPHGQDKEIAKQNFWHCSGSEGGRWVAADNWYGDITIFEGKTSRPRLLTAGHRTYGQGEHPHVGWDRKGKQVVFTSHLLGNPNVCIATIPEDWQQANP
jgi:hypothetical protein